MRQYWIIYIAFAIITTWTVGIDVMLVWSLLLFLPVYIAMQWKRTRRKGSEDSISH